MRVIRSAPFTLSRTSEISILIVLLVIAAILRFYSLEALPLWLDEAFTYQVSRLPLPNLLFTVIDIHPPLFYIIENFALRFGRSELILRFAPAVFGVLAVYMLHLIGRRFVSPICGLSAAAVLATSTVHIRYSQEARSYTLLFLEICIAAYGVLKFIEDRKNTGSSFGADTALKLDAIVIYLIGAVTALYTHNISVFYIFALNWAVLIAWRPLNYISNRMLIHWLAAQAVLLVLWLPWLVVFLDHAQSNVFSWLPHFSFPIALRTLMGVYGFSHFDFWGFRLAANFLVTWLILAGLITAFYSKHHKGLVIVAGLIVVMVPSVIWAVGFVTPVFLARTVLGCLLGSALGLGLAVAFAPMRVVAFFIIAFALVGNVVSTINYYETHAKEEWRNVARVVNSGTKEGDLVVLCEFFTYWPFRYYQETSDRDLSIAGWFSKENLLFEIDDSFMQKYFADPRLYTIAPTGEDFTHHYGVNVIADLGGSYRRIWLLQSHCKDTSKALRARIREAGFIIQSEEHFKDIDVIIFGPS